MKSFISHRLVGLRSNYGILRMFRRAYAKHAPRRRDIWLIYHLAIHRPIHPPFLPHTYGKRHRLTRPPTHNGGLRTTQWILFNSPVGYLFGLLLHCGHVRQRRGRVDDVNILLVLFTSRRAPCSYARSLWTFIHRIGIIMSCTVCHVSET